MKTTLASLRHHKTTALLIVLEVALASCLVVNALSVFWSKLGPMYWPTGVSDPSGLYLLRPEVAAMSAALSRGHAHAVDDLDALMHAGALAKVAEVNTLPLMQEQVGVNVRPSTSSQAALIETAVFAGTAGFVDTLGFRVIAGRPFEPADTDNYALATGETLSHTVMVSSRLSQKVWPGQDAVGKTLVYGNNNEYRAQVIGVVDHAIKPVPGAAETSEDVILELVRPFEGGVYAFRSAFPSAKGPLAQAANALESVAAGRVFSMRQTFADVHREFFEADRSLGYLLVFLIGALMLVCWLGVGALTSFWIRQRYRSIGIRRALGATRRGIWWQFTAENLTVVTLGLVIGLPVAAATNGWLVTAYAIPPLNLVCLPVVAVAFYLSCLGAIAFTVARATVVSPMVAVRS